MSHQSRLLPAEQPKHSHILFSVIKISTQEEADIYITIFSILHSFLVLDIDALFEKSRTPLNHFLHVPIQER